MLIEQAFMALPELLTGAPFKKYKNEGTVVTAFSMAVLQELNSRNVLNPVASLREEVNYPVAPNWRADLHLDLDALKIFTPDLSLYGYYQNNWLEAKFCRLGETGSPTVTNIKSTFLLLKDAIRLCALPPDSLAASMSESGRYLLHAYQGDPDQYFTYKRNGKGSRSERKWIEPLLTPGKQEIRTFELGREKNSTFSEVVGECAHYIRLSATLTNICHIPSSYGEGVYYIVLTRIDDFRVGIGSRWFSRKGGVMNESHNGAMYEVQKAAVKLLND